MIDGGQIGLVFGPDRHREVRRWLFEADPGGERPYLWLAGTPARREQVRRELVDPTAFEVPVHVLREHGVDWWHRYGDGRFVLGPRATTAAIRLLLDGSPERWPTLAAIPDRAATARAVAAAERELSHRRAPAPDAELRELLASLRKTLDGRGAILSSDAWEALAQRLADPGRALRAALSSPRAVVVEEPVGATPLEAALVATWVRAFAQAGAAVAVTLAAGRDEGGREVAVLLGWEPPDDRSTRVFAATAHTRRALFELVGTGEALVWLARGPELALLEPWTELGPAGERRPADALADQRPVDVADPQAWLGGLAVARLADERAEARFVAAGVARALASGVPPSECLVAVADPDGASVLFEALDDAAVPWRRSDGAPLRDEPAARALRWIAGQALDGFDPDGLCGLADLAGVARARDARRWCGAAGIAAGRPSTWALSRWAARNGVEGVEDVVEELERIAGLLEPLGEPQEAVAFVRRVLAVADALGVPPRFVDGPPAAAWAAAVRALDELGAELCVVDPGPWPAATLRDALDAALADARWQPGPPTRATVTVAPLDRVDGLVASRTWAVGLVRGAFPRPRRAGGPDSVARARYLLADLMRAADRFPLSPAALTLTWPASKDGVATAPSPLLAELLDLRTPQGPLGPQIVTEPAAEPDAAFTSDRLRARALRGEPVPEPHAARVAAARARQGPLGPWDGLWRAPPAAPGALAVSAAETYLACPARYAFTYVHRLAPPEKSTPELEPRRRGIAIHRILERFLRDRDLRPLAGERDGDGARARLFAAASTTLDEVEAEGGFDPLFQRWARRRWTAGLVDDAPDGVLGAWLEVERGGPASSPVAVERPVRGLRLGPVELRGVVDRLDRLPSGAHVVTDYKTGAPPSRARIEAGLSLQATAYAELVAAETQQPVAAAFVSLARADQLRRSPIVGEDTALAEACSDTERRRAIPLEAPDRRAALEKAGEALERLVAGVFPPTHHPPDLAGCPTCPYRRICRVDPVRHAVTT